MNDDAFSGLTTSESDKSITDKLDAVEEDLEQVHDIDVESIIVSMNAMKPDNCSPMDYIIKELESLRASNLKMQQHILNQDTQYNNLKTEFQTRFKIYTDDAENFREDLNVLTDENRRLHTSVGKIIKTHNQNNELS